MDDREVSGAWTRHGGRHGRRHGWTMGLVLALCGLFASAPAAAQWAVVDVPHTIKTAMGWVAQYQQMIETYQRQVEQLQTLDKQYEQALVTGEAYSGNAGYREHFQERGQDDDLVQRCGAVPARHPTGAEQHAYCTAMVRIENRRFNAVVAMLKDVSDRDGELREAYAERSGIGEAEEGKLASNSNRILSIQGQLQNDVQNSEQLLAAYDTTLRTLRENHIRVANEALKGSAGTTVVQGLALKIALHAARERDR